MMKIRNLKGFEDIREWYFVTKDGNVWSEKSNRFLKLMEKTGGYLYCCLIDDSKKKRYLRVHRLVAKAFLKTPQNSKLYVNHKDKNRQNNNIENLEWVTPRENNDHSLSKKIYSYNKKGVLLKVYKSSYEAFLDGFNRGHVCNVARGKAKTHKDIIFSYKLLSYTDIVQRLSKTYPR